MNVPSWFVDKLKEIREDIHCVFNNYLGLIQVIHRDNRSGIERIVYTVETEDGKFRQPDLKDFLHVVNGVAWNYLDMYPNPSTLWDEIEKKRLHGKMKKEEEAKEYRKWWNKEHRKEWRAAFENLKRGKVWMPEVPNKKVIIT